MDKINFNLEKNEMDLKVRFQKAKENKSFCEVIKTLDLSEEVLRKYTTSLEEASRESENCKKCSGIHDCKNNIEGSFLSPKKNGYGIVFSYVDCRYKNKEKYKENVSIFDLPKRLKDASMSNIYKNKDRVEIIKKIMAFRSLYLDGKNPKGIYLYGSFGAGKSYLIAALFNELAKDNVKSVIVHVPELIRSIKESFDYGDYALKFDLIKNVPLLLLDDIGAEYLTAWARDEIIEPILQYRMDQELPVFFTSNYDFKLLEKHFTLENDRLKAKRSLERIYQVSEPVELISRNLRDE